jgi:hypothetical protein
MKIKMGFALFFALMAALASEARPAHAANYVVYVHGRSMSTWPSAAYLGVPATWTHSPMSFNGSQRLLDSTIRALVKAEISTKCRGANQCIIVCYSAGCARMLVAFDDLRALGTPADRVLWTEAAASAAGGTELAAISTNAGLSLLRKIFLTNPGPDAEAIDKDLKINNMRSTLGYIQNSAPSVIYHLAGSKNICIKTKIRGLSALLSNVGQWIGGSVGGPVGSVIGGVLGSLFGSKSVKLCSNSVFPGGYGDGAVPVHSAAGYADTGSHANHADGGPKFNLRAYEQVPLFAVDHTGIFEPAVEKASLRLAINKDATCPGMPPEGSQDIASIVYEDGDSTVTESTPGQMLQICGQSALSDATEYASCVGQFNCCDNFSTGATSGCTCGEGLCLQSKWGTESFFTGDGCSGIEYSDGTAASYQSWDGLGTVGTTTATVTLRSARDASGACLALTHLTTNGVCPEYFPIAKSMTNMRRVYRPYIATYAADPSGFNDWPGRVVAVTTYTGQCR